jgi:hypothetical protein
MPVPLGAEADELNKKDKYPCGRTTDSQVLC